jgi:hypothetical protein
MRIAKAEEDDENARKRKQARYDCKRGAGRNDRGAWEMSEYILGMLTGAGSCISSLVFLFLYLRRTASKSKRNDGNDKP